MRVAVLLIALSSLRGSVLSRDWENGKLSLQLDGGVAEIEWLSATAFRIARGAVALPVTPKIPHERIVPEFEDTRPTLKMRGRYITVEIDKASEQLRVSANDETIATLSFDESIHVAPLGRTFGLAGPGDSQRFFFTARYGIFVRAPRDCSFDLDHGQIRASGPLELFFYFGPTPKELFEQHQVVVGKAEIKSPLPDTPLDSWEALASLVRTLNQWSLSGVLYPVLDLSSISPKGEPAKRAADLAAMMPFVESARWTPYVATYLREAFDRGYPLIRPLPFEFSRDKDLTPQPDVFMLGDEVLVAPVIAAGARRKLQLPRGVWTDLRTNSEYQGNQAIEVDAPAGAVPTFGRNGSILPVASKRAMELHYFPSLGAEFFLWEAGKAENSQFHAAPAGDYTRVQIESKIPRTYEWILHHADRPRSVEDNGAAYKPARQRSALKPGTWWHDAVRNNLHVMVYVEAGADRIVNISF